MSAEDTIIQDLANKFGLPEEKCIMSRPRRIFVEVTRDAFKNIVEYISTKLSFSMLCTITGLDAGEEIQMIYHIANEDGIIINLKVNVPKEDPVIETVTSIYQGAALYERELIDMLGVRVTGLPEGPRYPLPDTWPEGQYPLRKDWKPEMLNQNGGGVQNG